VILILMKTDDEPGNSYIRSRIECTRLFGLFKHCWLYTYCIRYHITKAAIQGFSD
jgi:hypothetical protein